MGSLPLGKTTSTFDHKSLQICLVSEISVIKNDEKKTKSSISSLNIHQIERIPKIDQNLFINFLCSKFDSLKELNLDDELDDGNPIEIRKIDIDKRVFPKKRNHAKFSKIKNSNKNLNIEKNQTTIHQISIQISYKNIIKNKFYNTNDLKEKSNSDRTNIFTWNEQNFKNPKKSKFYRHKKHAKSTKNKDYKTNLSLSIKKPKKFDGIKGLNNNNENERTNTKN